MRDLQGRESLGADDDGSLALSSLMDGEADAMQVQRACAAWRDTEDVRAKWHAFHLIGDVLRSDELACNPKHDADFLAALRARMVDEPVALAPQPVEPAPARPSALASRWRWAPPMAVAASFVAVAGALVVARMTVAPASDQQAALAPAATMAMPVPQALSNAFAETPVLASDKLVRDAHLDDYLTAHKQFGGGAGLGLPSGFMRDAAYEVPSR